MCVCVCVTASLPASMHTTRRRPGHPTTVRGEDRKGVVEVGSSSSCQYRAPRECLFHMLDEATLSST